MYRRPWLLIVATSLCLALSVQAGIIFHRHDKPNPAQRVPELLTALKSETSDSKRAAAAEELRQYDTTAFPAIVPGLLEALQADPKAEVRAEAAQSLGKLRPVAQDVGAALELALSNDSSVKVRWQARTALWNYHLAGYRSGKAASDGPSIGQPTNKEPPLAEPKPAPTPAATEAPQPAPPRLTPTPKEPPTWTPAPVDAGGKPLPTTPLVPTEPPLLTPPPADNDGPALTPPY